MTNAQPLVNHLSGGELRPMPGRVFVLTEKPKELSGAIHLPDTAHVPSVVGQVLATGGGVTTCHVGDKVAIAYTSGVSLSVSQPRYQFPPELLELPEGDVLAVWDGLDLIVHADVLPLTSLAMRWVPIPNHVLMRPYSPAGVYTGGLIAERNTKHPRVWAHLLAVPWDLLRDAPDLVPGRLVHYRRYSDELLGYDTRATGEADLPVVIAPASELVCVLTDPESVLLEVR